MNKTSVIKYFYEIVMAALAIINIIFFIFNFFRLKINLDASSVLLTFIGFFFAFGGMYVYSIFNANVDAEKRAINELKEKYEIELDKAYNSLSSFRKLLSFYQIGQLIVNSPKISTQHSAWVRQFGLLYNEQKEYLKELSKDGSPLYRSYKTDFIAVCRGISDSLQFLMNRVERDKKAFFDGSGLSQNNQDALLYEIKGLIADLLYVGEDIMQESKEIPIQATQEKESISQRFKKAWKILKNDTED